MRFCALFDKCHDAFDTAAQQPVFGQCAPQHAANGSGGGIACEPFGPRAQYRRRFRLITGMHQQTGHDFFLHGRMQMREQVRVEWPAACIYIRMSTSGRHELQAGIAPRIYVVRRQTAQQRHTQTRDCLPVRMQIQITAVRPSDRILCLDHTTKHIERAVIEGGVQHVRFQCLRTYEAAALRIGHELAQA